MSRSLAACEGAVLLVDAAQGIEAQTLANLYLALENDLTIIPVLNKIDLPAAQPEKYAEELAKLIGCEPEDCLRVSGKTGEGVEPLLDTIVAQLPAPIGDADAPARAMIFDSVYDTYRGVVTYVRVVDGNLNPRERIVMMSTRATHELLEIGVISPEPVPGKGLGVGEVGYLITGVKDVRQSQVGDTVTNASKPATEALGGYTRPEADGLLRPLSRSTASDYPDLRDALDKLKLNDAALVYEPETSAALGFGFRVRLPRPAAPRDRPRAPRARVRPRPHLDRAQRRLRGRRWTTARAVARHQPERVPRRQDRARSASRSCAPRSSRRASSSARSWSCASSKRGTLLGMDYLSEDRVEMRYTLPLAEIVFDFFDQLKSRTRGYASLDYEPDGEQVADLVKVDILLQGETGRRVLARSCTRTRPTPTAS